MLTDAGGKAMGITGSPEQQGRSSWNQGLGAGRIASLPIPYSSLRISVSLCELSSFIPTGDAPSACQHEHTSTLSPSVVPREENFFLCLYINPRLRCGDIRPPLGPMNLCYQRVEIVRWFPLWPGAECVLSGGGGER